MQHSVIGDSAALQFAYCRSLIIFKFLSMIGLNVGLFVVMEGIGDRRIAPRK
jgi:hypothetical protein